MAEPQKATSSAVGSKPKEKGSLLDEEIGKDFLSSWKSMSVTQDDAMDFSFGTISRGKKKAFNFDKLDMDFNMDGDFGKLSSFKVDMIDLDFSSPSKGTENDKEKSKEETTSGKRQEKKDRFTFSFDFNELDGFDFDSSPTKGEKNCKKSQHNKAVALESSEISNIDLALEDDCTAAKLQLSKNETNPEAETSKGGTEACNSMDVPCPSKAVPLQGLEHGNSVVAQGSRISPEKIMDADVKEKEKIVDTDVKEKYKSSPLSNKAVSAELYDQQFLQSSSMDSLGLNNSNQETVSNMQAEVCSQGTRSNTSSGAEQNVNEKIITTEGSIHKKYTSSPLSSRAVSSELCNQQSLQTSPMDSLSGNHSNQETLSNMQAEVCSQRTRINTSSDAEQNVNDKKINTDGSIHQKLHRKNSFPPSDSDKDDRTGAGCNMPTEIHDCQSVQDDTILKDISASSLEETSDKTGAKKNNQNPTSKFSLVSSDSEPTLSQPTTRKDREAGVIRSLFFRRSEKTISHLPKPSETEKEVSSFSSKKIGDMHLCPANEKREDSDGGEARKGRQLVGYSKLCSQESAKGRLVLHQRENDVGRSSEIRDGFIASAVQIGGSKFIGKSCVQDKEATKGESVLLRSEKNASLRANLPNSSAKTTESGIQTSVNPKPKVPKTASIQNSKFLSEAPKRAKEAPALSIFKSARSIEPSKDELNSQRESIPLRNLEQNKDSPRNTFKIVLPVGNGENKTPKLPSLKRKAVEEPSGDLMLLTPRKRLSQSPSERNIKETSERVADEEVQNQKNTMEVPPPKDIQSDHLISESEVPKEVNMTEQEFPSGVENDGIVEKAEAYAKGLDEICNMLEKKHEEAKELLVRALVNKNNLLMLNHVMVKEKINMVEKFAELLISKEMPT